ncbi:MAG: KTSC domain-containing protein, partial [Lachnospiraceae bacterium]|nr:KTSC domain-containing protein [Lachnospiraceae bacterium]
MNMIPVSSSNIASIGYDGSTLHIRFNSGSLYAYYNVPESVYSGLMNASS